MGERKLIVATAQGWFDNAMNPANSMSVRLCSMENALNHTENALAAERERRGCERRHNIKIQGNKNVRIFRLQRKLNVANERAEQAESQATHYRTALALTNVSSNHK